MSNIYNKLREERLHLLEQDLVPEWMSTAGYQLFKEKYLYQADNPREQYERIAATLSAHTEDPNMWRDKFFNLLWKGWLSPSTPVLANTGTTRGLPVSCAGTYISDNLDSIYNAKHEVAMLTKAGFGTASYLGDLRGRGDSISVGGKSSGLLPIIEGFQKDMEYVSQGTARRGSWAGYVRIDHKDFDEVCDYLFAHPDGNNIGWVVGDDFIDDLRQGDEEAIRRYGKAMKTKMVTGKGYFFFDDKANAKRPQWYKDQNLDIKSSQLCSEIMLHSSEDYTYTCVLSSMNLSKWDEWRETEAVFQATVFLDAVVQEFIERAKNMAGLEKAVAFTKNSRALGLGVCGFHSYLQQNLIPFESFEAHQWNTNVFVHLDTESRRASEYLARTWGEPKWMKGYGMANTHRLAVAPTKSTALIMGGISEGINPDTAMVYTQRTPAGEVDRINPALLRLMKEKGVYNQKNIEEVRDAHGSVQHVDWLDDDEKLAFRTAFEIDQDAVIRLASNRGRWIDQWQSLNLFFAAGEDEGYVNSIHKKAFLDPNILALYYVYSKAGVITNKDECLACQ